jgi:Amt family ammonium transporter
VLLLDDVPTIDTGNTTWLLVSSALVLLMTPGLAFFYGGLNRSKSVLNMMMMSFSCIGLISILWTIYGFSLAFGTNDNASVNDWIGSFTSYLGGNTGDSFSTFWFAGGTSTGIPVFVFMAFQMMFAIITVALTSGAISDRAKFFGWLLFAFGWFTLVYVPVAHWIWGGGFIATKIHALDFAGGTAVHINAGAAALALALVLGKRLGWPKEKMKPHNVPFVALGAGLLWFGWFGFNAGSELTADGTAAVAFLNTQVATAAALMSWILVEWIRDGKPTLVGASSGAVAGLVAITPACGFISPWAAIVLGLVAGAVCALAVSLKYKFGFDDSLDVVGVHFVGGWIGSLSLGFFANSFVNSWITDPKILGAQNGVFYGGGWGQLLSQFEGSAIVSVFSFSVAFIIAKLIDLTVGFRAKAEVEIDGIDVAEHAESAYDFAPGGGSASAFALAGIATSKTSAPAEAEEAAPATEKVSG